MVIARVTAGLLAVAATSAAAQLRPAPLDNILAATDACRAAVISGGVDQERLTVAGWEVGTATGPSGAPIEGAMRVFGKSGNDSLIMLIDATPALCTAMAGLENSAAFAALGAALAGEAGARVAERNGREQTLFVGDSIVNIARTGTERQPAVRIAVMKVESSQ